MKNMVTILRLAMELTQYLFAQYGSFLDPIKLYESDYFDLSEQTKLCPTRGYTTPGKLSLWYMVVVRATSNSSKVAYIEI